MGLGGLRSGAAGGRCFTVVELMTVVAVVMVLTAIAIPKVAEMQYRAKASELRTNVEGIVIAEIAYEAVNDTYLDCSTGMAPNGSFPPPRYKRPWTGSRADCYKPLGWAPDGDVYGAYIVTLHARNTSTYMTPTCTCGGNTDYVIALGNTDVDGDMAMASWWQCAPKTLSTLKEGSCSTAVVY